MTKPECRIALICLGSNEESAWGGALATVQKAMLMVAGLSEKPAQSSALYATPAFPKGAGPDFVNAAMAIFTTVSPADLLDHLHRIEAAAGRQRTKRWGQRTLDLDLIAVGDMILPDQDTYAYWHHLPLRDQLVETPAQLILPHPRMQDRAFVLVPLCDVAPDWRHPVLGRSVAEICADLPSASRAEVTPLTAPDDP
ncbi:2-amino-4-hydroxy-6-hydroxymethyldihydropteridine pyrophosphokinase [Loktanella sp. 5RATIMAR09]|uniref:2-amino-4-hydroxy-6- hydroxymethyldihydropteridine diphosphokinase n=1 Tax=Loktanella sp. 5RATIMAR09 TaxID=1225655 RepID=UPI0006EB518D|nr:2-amino-4-hydroxy-6-hydroxymethyldihydropteridine diphosphokinase [Loktanella sp. 5RATIMAR09]KQI71954.1 2-amino-4-hydroxy-6-hydroxymethyldihydropteridine pyrophosphokinase [Loktanella sp. 5RATIMAR09]